MRLIKWVTGQGKKKEPQEKSPVKVTRPLSVGTNQRHLNCITGDQSGRKSPSRDGSTTIPQCMPAISKQPWGNVSWTRGVFNGRPAAVCEVPNRVRISAGGGRAKPWASARLCQSHCSPPALFNTIELRSELNDCQAGRRRPNNEEVCGRWDAFATEHTSAQGKSVSTLICQGDWEFLASKKQIDGGTKMVRKLRLDAF